MTLRGLCFGLNGQNSVRTTHFCFVAKPIKCKSRHNIQNRTNFPSRVFSSTPTFNPQNTDQPKPLPNPDFSPEQCVHAQLEALSRNDHPWPSHGIHLAYEYGYDIGGLDRSMFFGFPKDLYHLDHFMGMFATHLKELVNCASYEFLGQATKMDDEDDHWTVPVMVRNPNTSSSTKFIFHLKRKKVGARKGSLMTAMIQRVE